MPFPCFGVMRDHPFYLQTIVAMSAMFMHHDADVFEDPRAFRPERWLDQSVEKAHMMERFLVPFSKGPRSCLGIKYVHE